MTTAIIPFEKLARAALDAADKELARGAALGVAVEQSFVLFGEIMAEIEKNDYWKIEFKSWGKYVEILGKKYRKGRTQLMHYKSTVQALLPLMSKEDLSQIGISKAIALKQEVIRTGNAPSPELMQIALDPASTEKDVKRAIFLAAKTPFDSPDPADGESWYDLDGFPVTPEQRLVLDNAFEAAWRAESIQENMPERMRVKAALLLMSMEFLGAHSDVLPEIGEVK